jgi:hypothetical protein
MGVFLVVARYGMEDVPVRLFGSLAEAEEFARSYDPADDLPEPLTDHGYTGRPCDLHFGGMWVIEFVGGEPASAWEPQEEVVVAE